MTAVIVDFERRHETLCTKLGQQRKLLLALFPLDAEALQVEQEKALAPEAGKDRLQLLRRLRRDEIGDNRHRLRYVEALDRVGK